MDGGRDEKTLGLPDSLIVVSCGTCRKLLAVDPVEAAIHRVAKVAGRIKGRSYCSGCLAVSGAGVSGIAGGLATNLGSPSPWNENANRAREDGSP